MKTFEITFGCFGGGMASLPAKRVKASHVKYDAASNMLLFIEYTGSADEQVIYRVDRSAVLAVEAF